MDTSNLKDMAFEGLKYVSPISYMIANKIKSSSERSDKIIDEGDTDKMRLELQKKEIETRIRELEAKISQEIAIANRIENAVEVEIEEYYEGSGKGNAGVNKDEDKLTFGFSGEGRKVTKRIYKFKGVQENK